MNANRLPDQPGVIPAPAEVTEQPDRITSAEKHFFDHVGRSICSRPRPKDVNIMWEWERAREVVEKTLSRRPFSHEFQLIIDVMGEDFAKMRERLPQGREREFQQQIADIEAVMEQAKTDLGKLYNIQSQAARVADRSLSGWMDALLKMKKLAKAIENPERGPEQTAAGGKENDVPLQEIREDKGSVSGQPEEEAPGSTKQSIRAVCEWVSRSLGKAF